MLGTSIYKGILPLLSSSAAISLYIYKLICLSIDKHNISVYTYIYMYYVHILSLYIYKLICLSIDKHTYIGVHLYKAYIRSI